MKITEDILKNGKWLDDEIFKLGKTKYRLVKCKKCGNDCFIRHYKTEGFCNYSCVHKDKIVSKETLQRMSDSQKGHHWTEKQRVEFSKTRSGENHWTRKMPYPEKGKKKMSITRKGKRTGEESNFWKGGVSELNIAPFETYGERLEKYEEVRNNDGILEVRCAYCGKWYKPSPRNARARFNFINGKTFRSEGRFYCSEECKSSCPVYNRRKYPKGYAPATSREIQPELRKLVFERDNWTCLKCGNQEQLHCHHIDLVINNPIESADIDNCITLCKLCHITLHKQKNCRKRICNKVVVV